MKKINIKGFTLVELLVSIVILGIITGISIPLIKNIQNANENRKYVTYADSLLSGAKLYNDAYAEDLFGDLENGCAYISYEQLETKKLIKPIQIDGMTCKNEGTFVKIIKMGKKYGYKVYLNCTDMNNKNLKSYPKENTIYKQDETSCGGVEGSSIVAVANPQEALDFKAKKRNVTVNLKSNLGIKTAKVKYQWVYTDINGMEKTTDFIDLKYNLLNEAEQKKRLERDGDLPPFESQIITTPEDADGMVFLNLKIDELKDLFNDKNNIDNLNNLGRYNVDNIKPFITNIGQIDFKDGKQNFYLPLVAGDNHTDNNKLRICVTFNDKCKNSEYVDYYSYVKNKDTNRMNYSEYAGKEKKVKIFVKDLAGNEYKTEVKYKFPKTYILKYHSDSNDTNCNNKKKEITTTIGNKTVWGTLCKPTKQNGKQFVGWETKNGDIVDQNTIVNGNIDVYAKWKDSKIIFRFQIQDGENLMSPTTSNSKSYYWKNDKANNNYVYKSSSINSQYSLYTVQVNANASSVTLPKYNNQNGLNISKNGMIAYSGKEWICVSGCKVGKTFKAGENTISKNDICDASKGDCYVTLKVNWNENKVKIKLNANGLKNVTKKNGYSVDKNGNILYNDKEYMHIISYGGSLTDDGLLDYNNSKALNLTRDGWNVPNGSEWNTKPDGTGTSYNQKKKYNASDFCSASNGDCTVVLYLNWKKLGKVNIQLNINGGNVTKISNNYTIDSNGNVLYKGSKTVHTITYGSSMDSNGLLNYNSSNLTVSKENNTIIKDSEWFATIDGVSKIYSQSSVYSASDFCDASKGDCTVKLYLNWVAQPNGKQNNDRKVIIKLNANGGKMKTSHGAAYTIDSSGNILKNNDSIIQIIYNNEKETLIAYNDKNAINLTKNNATIEAGKEWNTNKDGNGISYSQSGTYSVSDFCTKNNCIVTLYANWKNTSNNPTEPSEPSQNPDTNCTDISKYSDSSIGKTGTKVKIGKNNFYIVENRSDEVILIAEKRTQKSVDYIDVFPNAEQNENKAFMNKYGKAREKERGDPDSKSNIYVYNEKKSKVQANINSYVMTIKNDLCSSTTTFNISNITGRLPSFGDIRKMSESGVKSDIINGDGEYWTGSDFHGQDFSGIWYAGGFAGIAHASYSANGEKHGIRPVIVIPKK